MTPISPALVAVRTSFVLVMLLALQLSVVNRIEVFGVRGDLMLLAAVGAGLAAGADRGAAIGFASGLAYDLVLQTPFGLSALTYAIVAYLAGSLQDSVLRASWWIPLATVFVASAAGIVLYGLLGTVVGTDLVHWDLLRTAALVGLLNTVVALPVLRAMRWATGWSAGLRPRAVYR